LIWVHGGLWRNGDAAKIPPLLFELARRGYAGASVEFRQSDEAVFPAQLDDLRAATRFLRQKASNFSLDGNKIGAGGISTGAHLAALLALGGGERCAINICGPSDLTALNQKSRLVWDETGGPVYDLLGGSVAQKTALARAASPLLQVGKNPPPFLILHGEDDSLVALSQSEALFERLKKAGGAVTYRIYRGEEHGLRGAQPEIEAETLAFLAKWLPK
jgi:acetyl esterase/lipase